MKHGHAISLMQNSRCGMIIFTLRKRIEFDGGIFHIFGGLDFVSVTTYECM